MKIALKNYRGDGSDGLDNKWNILIQISMHSFGGNEIATKFLVLIMLMHF
jgi:hypothetical protein